MMKRQSADNQRTRRTKILRVVVSEDEAALIAAHADGARTSVSSYLRRGGLGDPPKSKLDQRLVLELVRINGDQGRLGGLLKLWLSERPGQGSPAFDVRKLLREIEALQRELQAGIRAIWGKRRS